MDISSISTLVTTVGFPIACCIACFWYINKSGDRYRQELSAMTEAINNNTLVIQKLADKLEG